MAIPQAERGRQKTARAEPVYSEKAVKNRGVQGETPTSKKAEENTASRAVCDIKLLKSEFLLYLPLKIEESSR